MERTMMRTTMPLGPDCPAGSEVAYAGEVNGLAGVAIPGGVAWVHPDVLEELPEGHVSKHLQTRRRPVEVRHEIPPGVVEAGLVETYIAPEDLGEEEISRIRRSHNSLAEIAQRHGLTVEQVRELRVGARAGR